MSFHITSNQVSQKTNSGSIHKKKIQSLSNFDFYSHVMMSIEQLLTRELDIRFIDARELVNEAKLSLGIVGYPSKEQLQRLQEQSVSLFDRLPENQKSAMRRRNGELTAIKSQSLSSSSRTRSSSISTTERDESSSSDDVSCHGRSLTSRGWLRRTFSSD